MNMILTNINENEDDSIANNMIEEEKHDPSHKLSRKSQTSPENVVTNALF